MHHRCAFPLLALCVWLAAALPAPSGAEIAVYGFELDVDEARERLLIFADAPLVPELIPVDERTLMVSLPGAVLDPTAPTQIQPVTQGTVQRVTAFDRADATAPPGVRVVIQHRPGAPPRLEQRASVVALDFEPRPRAPADADTIPVAYRNAPMQKVVTDLARATGQSLIFDEALSGLGVITIEGPPRVSRGEALALLDSVLLLRGFAAVPAPGGGRKIVPISGDTGPWVAAAALPDSDAPVTTLLRLKTAKATDLVSVVSPYLGSAATAAAFEPTNSLILSGPASRLRRLRTAIEALDQIEIGAPVIWSLQYADPEAVADQLTEILGERELPLAVGDARTRSLLLRIQPDAVEEARALVDRLDRPDRGAAELEVIPLRFADAETLAEQLNSLRDDTPTDEARDPTARQVGLRGLPFDVVADHATRSLVVRADASTFATLLDVVRSLDRAPASVRVRATIATVDLGDGLDLGVDFLAPLTPNPKSPQDLLAAVLSNPSGGGIPQGPSESLPFIARWSRSPLLFPIVDPITGEEVMLEIPREQVSITANKHTVRTNMLMNPELLASSGEENELFVGDNIPVITARNAGEGDVANPLRVSQNVERYDVGTRLRVKPTVGVEGVVVLELEVEQSSLRPSVAGSVDAVGPTIGQIQVTSTIRLHHGDVAVIATSAQPTVVRSETGAPWLKDIPVLGNLFRATHEEQMDRHLLIAVQAEILRPEAVDLARALARELGPLDPADRLKSEPPRSALSQAQP